MHYVTVKSILSPSNGFNIFRGCLHGCIYCDSRSKCYHIEHDFEDIEVKENGPILLENTLRRKKEKCMIGTGSMCDPYIPLEKEIEYTRKCLQIIDYYAFGLNILTKSDLILRDLDLLKSINIKAKTIVQMTITTADDSLCRIIEPNVALTSRRFEVLDIMYQNNIETVVWLCPILPFINDTKENILEILNKCARHHVYGIINFGFGVTLRDGDREYFYQQLDKNFKGLKEKYMSIYKDAYEVSSPNNNYLYKIFKDFCIEHHIEYDTNKIFAHLREFPKQYEQLSLFED